MLGASRGQGRSLGIFVSQLLEQSLALSTAQKTFNIPNPRPCLLPPHSHSVLLDSYLVAQSEEDQSEESETQDQSGVGRAQDQSEVGRAQEQDGVGGAQDHSTSHQVWSSARPRALATLEAWGKVSGRGWGLVHFVYGGWGGEGSADEMPTEWRRVGWWLL